MKSGSRVLYGRGVDDRGMCNSRVVCQQCACFAGGAVNRREP